MRLPFYLLLPFLVACAPTSNETDNDSNNNDSTNNGTTGANSTLVAKSVEDVTVSLSIATAKVKEGGGSSYSAVVTVEFEPNAPEKVPVTIVTEDGDAIGGTDYKITEVEVFAGPTTSSQAVSVPILGNRIEQPDRIFYAKLKDIGKMKMGTEKIAITIEDDDQGLGSGDGYVDPAQIGLSIKPLKVTEKDDTSTEARVFFDLNGKAYDPITVTYATKEAEAEEGVDYTHTTGTVTFLPGVQSQEVRLPILGDLTDEPNEVFHITITDLGGLNESTSELSDTITITDNDPPPKISFVEGSSVATESSGRVNIPIILDADSAMAISVPINILGTAKRGDDYEFLSEQLLTIAPGDTSASLAVEIENDSIPEGGESIVLQFGQPIFSTVGEHGEHFLVISGDVAINDTGVTHFSDGTDNSLVAAPEGYELQDASHGRDFDTHRSDDGRAGFSFDFLNSGGGIWEYTAEEPTWSCVLDNTTGLVWEKKWAPYHPALDEYLINTYNLGSLTRFASESPYDWYEAVREYPSGDDGLPAEDKEDIYSWASRFWRASNWVYAWYTKEPNINGGSTGPYTKYPSSGPFGKSSVFKREFNSDLGARMSLGDNTAVFTDELNRYGICGYRSWRLPTIDELRGVMDLDPVQHEGGSNSHITDYFPYSVQGIYATSTPGSDGDASFWGFDTRTGRAVQARKNEVRFHIRAVADRGLTKDD